eukprot:GABV01008831.1.p1 GENE.GABV01008831.1~~GABV01008831.1.p1  ORF type:complete len:318 (+),score=81.86 GABV01008831.1:132-956(+)
MATAAMPPVFLPTSSRPPSAGSAPTVSLTGQIGAIGSDTSSNDSVIGGGGEDLEDPFADPEWFERSCLPAGLFDDIRQHHQYHTVANPSPAVAAAAAAAALQMGGFGFASQQQQQKGQQQPFYQGSTEFFRQCADVYAKAPPAVGRSSGLVPRPPPPGFSAKSRMEQFGSVAAGGGPPSPSTSPTLSAVFSWLPERRKTVGVDAPPSPLDRPLDTTEWLGGFSELPPPAAAAGRRFGPAAAVTRRVRRLEVRPPSAAADGPPSPELVGVSLLSS